MAQLTVVMYHYVRQLERSRYPGIKGLTVADFIGQLGYLERHYQFVTVEQCIDALDSDALDEWPDNAVLLSFDDGYLDHFTSVFPLLEERGIQGLFYPPAAPVLEHKVLDVNKIHFVLAGAPGIDRLLDDVYLLLDEFRAEHNLAPNRDYFDRLTREAGRYDPPEIVFIKRLLQRELDEALRGVMVDRLFAKYVSVDEAAFAGELYMNVDQLRCMLRHGMHVGSHGFEHYWLDRLDREEQAREIDRSLEFLGQLGAPLASWTMCYPYGAHDRRLREILRSRGCRLGLTTEVGIAELDRDHALMLGRLNTNDLPRDECAPAVDWTRKVAGGKTAPTV